MEHIEVITVALVVSASCAAVGTGGMVLMLFRMWRRGVL